MTNLIPINAKTLTMSSLEIAKLVEQRHDNVKRTMEALFKKGVVTLPQIEEVTNPGPGPKAIGVYSLGKRDTLIVVAQLSPEFTARVVDRWQELEEQATNNVVALPNFSNPADAARAWAEQYEARLTAEKTKAEIGSRREATAMATASYATQKAKKLEIELDQSQQYCTVKRMQMLHHGQQFDWRLLKATANEMGLPPEKVFDANYGTVNAYHADVWAEAYAINAA